jgi:hypothetical protein
VIANVRLKGLCSSSLGLNCRFLRSAAILRRGLLVCSRQVGLLPSILRQVCLASHNVENLNYLQCGWSPRDLLQSKALHIRTTGASRDATTLQNAAHISDGTGAHLCPGLGRCVTPTGTSARTGGTLRCDPGVASHAHQSFRGYKAAWSPLVSLTSGVLERTLNL